MTDYDASRVIPAPMGGLPLLGLPDLSLENVLAQQAQQRADAAAAAASQQGTQNAYNAGAQSSNPTGVSGGGGGKGTTPGKSSGGGYGPERYGVNGTTGLSNQRGSAKYGLQPQFWSALGQANAAMRAAGLGTFGITDGFRSYSAQVATKKAKGSLAATPGHSVHGIGLAADLSLTSRQLRWLKANGGKYGLINLPSESWHWQMK
jgi:zinc D-Ala-D-Ala carboxypeptidase